MSPTEQSATWPELRWADWRDTAITLQLWTQIVGKVRLSLTPWLNHGWQVPPPFRQVDAAASCPHLSD